MLETIKHLIESGPGISSIVLTDKCSSCGDDVFIEITLTPGGVGLQGGALFKGPTGGYYAKCPGCYASNRAARDREGAT